MSLIPIRKRLAPILALGCLFALRAPAQHPHADETDTPAMGVVAFANSGATAAQKDFLQGLAQLHNFQYEPAAAAFRRAEQIDPDFAMAYWGEAMTHNHPIWAQQDLDAARAAMAKLGTTPGERAGKAPTVREKAYLAALEVLYGDGEKYDRDRRYALAMERLHVAFPDDIDATCFYALALLGTAHSGRDVPTYMRAAALMEEVFERHPQHPGAAHYLIHSVDDAAHAPLGLHAANAYSEIAPDSPHALHMTSHIYLALGMWAETAAANERSIAVSVRRWRAMDPEGPLPGCGHPYTWLHYAYLQQGLINKARKLLEACGAEVRDRPSTATGADLLDYDNTSAGSYHEMRSRQIIDSQRWQDAGIAHAPTRDLPLAEYIDHVVVAFAAAQRSQIDAGTRATDQAAQGARVLDAAAAKAGILADHPQRRVRAIEISELRGLLLLRQGERSKAVDLLTQAAAAERELPMDFGPPSLHKPANELLGEILLELGSPEDARTAFEHAQRLAPGRVQSLRGLSQCAQALNDAELAASVSARLNQIRADAGADES
jgi:tetratricopeptide (TPR) repeat protein